MRQCWIFFYIIVQCTWGILQTVAGFLLFLRYRTCPHEFLCGAVHTWWKKSSGISLGLFIFTPEEEAAVQETGTLRNRESKDSGIKNSEVNRLPAYLTVHEYGHTIQSLILGPFYLVVVGVPSVVWANFPACVRWRKERQIPYSWFWVEKWANQLGNRVQF